MTSRDGPVVVSWWKSVEDVVDENGNMTGGLRD